MRLKWLIWYNKKYLKVNTFLTEIFELGSSTLSLLSKIQKSKLTFIPRTKIHRIIGRKKV